ncbi:Hypothetical protein GbCGDNIH6_8178 [Granulibacter bethesdensis]|uniref:hypothetical protein n=1 Tax=Granulibacter bethesdensis TaxID=364410 RepID=UPI00090BE9AA|nr:hypothetical protein [Granulibacter bethesdensis]APH55925.1 Hypothetical protein GbCGDNIH6_8178 [Granulibacter bethesdensis]
MTENLNTGAFNSFLKGIPAHTPSLVGTTVFYIRNLTDNKIYFYDDKPKFTWFSADQSINALVIKPPQPIIYNYSTTNAIIYISQGSTQGINNKYMQFHFTINSIDCFIDFTFGGFRRITITENGKDVEKGRSTDGNEVSVCNLFSNINLRTIWGYDLCIIDVFTNDQTVPDMII